MSFYGENSVDDHTFQVAKLNFNSNSFPWLAHWWIAIFFFHVRFWLFPKATPLITTSTISQQLPQHERVLIPLILHLNYLKIKDPLDLKKQFISRQLHDFLKILFRSVYMKFFLGQRIFHHSTFWLLWYRFLFIFIHMNADCNINLNHEISVSELGAGAGDQHRSAHATSGTLAELQI